jgi:hypothetical protein
MINTKNGIQWDKSQIKVKWDRYTHFFYSCSDLDHFEHGMRAEM